MVNPLYVHNIFKVFDNPAKYYKLFKTLEDFQTLTIRKIFTLLSLDE